MKQILIVDDEPNMCKVLKMMFENVGYGVLTTTSGFEAKNIVNNHNQIDLVISDLKLNDIDGFDILSFIKGTGRQIPFIMITAYGTIELAVEAMKKGATDFITKPFNKEVMKHKVDRIFRQLKREGELLHRQNTYVSSNAELVFQSEAMKNIMNTVYKVATVPRPVLIVGESGCGKEMVAKEIHRIYSSGMQKPFISINCPAIPESLIESELFGYDKGAFTNATKDYKGKLRIADGGTLLLDEIGELPLSIQPKLLRFLEEKRFMAIGSTKPIDVNTRIICATNRNLEEMIAQEKFRKDLYYRINTIVLRIPPLRDRKEDIAQLTYYFLRKFADELNYPMKSVSDEVIEAFNHYEWPGNVRELRNIVERAILMSSCDEIKPIDIPQEILYSSQAEPIGNHHGNGENIIEDAEKKLLLTTLKNTNWNVSKAAKELGITRSTIRYRIRKYNLKTS